MATKTEAVRAVLLENFDFTPETVISKVKRGWRLDVNPGLVYTVKSQMRKNGENKPKPPSVPLAVRPPLVVNEKPLSDYINETLVDGKVKTLAVIAEAVKQKGYKTASGDVYGTVQKKVQKMYQDGEIERFSLGKYRAKRPPIKIIEAPPLAPVIPPVAKPQEDIFDAFQRVNQTVEALRELATKVGGVAGLRKALDLVSNATD